MTTTKKVNAALEAAGLKNVELHKDRRNGQFYFWGGEAIMWHETGVAVYRLTDLSVEQWVAEAMMCKEEI